MFEYSGESLGYLVGWKKIGAFFGVPPSTIRRWHYRRLQIPYLKTYPSKQGRVVIAVEMAEKWYRHMCALYPSLYRIKRSLRMGQTNNE